MLKNGSMAGGERESEISSMVCVGWKPSAQILQALSGRGLTLLLVLGARLNTQTCLRVLCFGLGSGTGDF